MSAPDAATVLVVDDEPRIGEIVRRWLAEDYRVATATDGAGAMDGAADADALVLDRSLPDRNGPAVAEALRERGFAGPILLLTADKSATADLSPALDAVLTKPTDEATLREALAAHLD